LIGSFFTIGSALAIVESVEISSNVVLLLISSGTSYFGGGSI